MHVISNYPVWYKRIEAKLGVSRHLPWTFISCEGPMKVLTDTQTAVPASHVTELDCPGFASSQKHTQGEQHSESFGCMWCIEGVAKAGSREFPGGVRHPGKAAGAADADRRQAGERDWSPGGRLERPAVQEHACAAARPGAEEDTGWPDSDRPWLMADPVCSAEFKLMQCTGLCLLGRMTGSCRQPYMGGHP